MFVEPMAQHVAGHPNDGARNLLVGWCVAYEAESKKEVEGVTDGGDVETGVGIVAEPNQARANDWAKWTGRATPDGKVRRSGELRFLPSAIIILPMPYYRMKLSDYSCIT